ncbi:MAG: AmmeMemoRadiSam system radical SAM enzyme [Saccharofermentanales bacterium]
MKEAMFYEQIPDSENVKCNLCPHYCRIIPGKHGQCGIRKNIDGRLYAMTYEKVSSLSVDPIEKKPLYHFYPGSHILSAGSVGCNLKCPFCQNHIIARGDADHSELAVMSSAELVDKAVSLKEKGNIGIAYTYNEPFIWFEYVFETARLAREHGLKNVLVTNGYVCSEPLDIILPFIDAMNIDLKSYSDDFYKKHLNGGLEEVKETIKTSAGRCHVEITTLVIPGYTDAVKEIEQAADFISNISPEIPLHLTRFFPRYKWSDLEATHLDKLHELAETAKKYLKYVYVGNV